MILHNEVQSKIAQAVSQTISELAEHEFFKLLGVVQFSSTDGKCLKTETDVDLMFVFGKLPLKRRERVAFFEFYEKRLNSNLKKLEGFGFYFHASPLLRTLDEWNNYHPLLLDMDDKNVVHLDSQNCITEVLRKIKNWKLRYSSLKIECGLRHYWILASNLGQGEQINYSL